MFEKVMKGIQRRLKEVRRGSQLICSDLLQNWLAAGVVCPIKLRSILYRLAGNKIVIFLQESFSVLNRENCPFGGNIH